jgi:hypothetical protein
MSALLVWTGQHIQSTRQAAALAKPPPSVPITTRVVSRVVSASVTMAGAVGGGTTQAIDPPTLPGSESAVVTSVAVNVGNTVADGKLLADVSGRPVIALRGRFPMYRPLVLGDTGPDVAELQAGLIAAGYAVRDLNGRLGWSTLRAAESLYRRVGYGIDSEPAADVQATPATGSTPNAAVPPSVSVVEVGELVFVPTLPAVVGAVETPRGPVSDGQPILTLRWGSLDIQASPSAGQETGVKPGDAAEVTIQGLPHDVPAKVRSVGTSAAGGAQGGDTVIVLTPARPLPAAADGETATVLITLSRTAGRVNAVPLSAIGSAADGSPMLRVVAGNGSIVSVEVETGQVGDGYAELRSAPPSVIVGLRVVVGENGNVAGQ